jgi:Ser/Thr protein kinase RdoA (MazF antagonist)
MSDLNSVLERYGLHPLSLEPLGDTQNANHRVVTADGAYLLRQHRNAAHSRAALESELVWLEHLGAQGVRVQRPRRAVDGGFIVALNSARYSVLTWLEGATLEVLDDAQAEQLGALLGQLHDAALGFTPPAGFERPCYDVAHLERTLETLRAIPWLEPDVPLFTQAIVGAQRGFEAIPAHGWGLIHADPHPGNLLWDGAELTLIDFDLCGFGPFAYDVVSALGYLEPGEHPAFLRGYELVRPLPASFHTARAALQVAEWLTNLAFLAPRPQDRDFVDSVMLPGLREQLPAKIALMLEG